MLRGTSSDDELTKAAEVFAIGIGECGSNIVGSYLKASEDRKLPSRVRGYLLMNTLIELTSPRYVRSMAFQKSIQCSMAHQR
ncbi:MAG: hypothetical protein ACW960_09710 [Candidatus Thorarchaeota archaeon]|jgi:hypothetical protein